MRTMPSFTAILAVLFFARCGPGHPPAPPPEDIKSKTVSGKQAGQTPGREGRRRSLARWNGSRPSPSAARW